MFPEHVYVLYYANDEAFTRLVEYKKFAHHKSPTGLVGMEIPSVKGRHYPLPFKADQELARKYFGMMPEHVYSIGRNVLWARYRRLHGAGDDHGAANQGGRPGLSGADGNLALDTIDDPTGALINEGEQTD